MRPFGEGAAPPVCPDVQPGAPPPVGQPQTPGLDHPAQTLGSVSGHVVCPMAALCAYVRDRSAANAVIRRGSGAAGLPRRPTGAPPPAGQPQTPGYVSGHVVCPMAALCAYVRDRSAANVAIRRRNAVAGPSTHPTPGPPVGSPPPGARPRRPAQAPGPDARPRGARARTRPHCVPNGSVVPVLARPLDG